MRNVSNEFKASVFSQQTDEVFIALITISHESFTDDIRVASDPFELLPTAGERGVVSNGLEYIYLPFRLVLPSEDDTGVARARLEMDNVDRRAVAAIRNANSSLSVNIDIVLASDVDNVEMSVQDFRLEKVRYDALTISGDLTVEYYDLEPFPYQRFTPSAFQGMF